MNKVVYTCLFYSDQSKYSIDKSCVNNNDKLEGWDYIIFTNITDVSTIIGWTPIYKKLINNHPIYTARHYKWLAHKYLTDYDIAIYVDAYLIPKTEIMWQKYIDMLSVDNAIILVKHPNRQCIYDECNAIINCKKDTKKNMDDTIFFLKSANMPSRYGLCETGLFLRYLKSNQFNNLCEELFDLMLQFTYRDQALITYFFWKHKMIMNFLFTRNFYHTSGKNGTHTYVNDDGSSLYHQIV